PAVSYDPHLLPFAGTKPEECPLPPEETGDVPDPPAERQRRAALSAQRPPGQPPLSPLFQVSAGSHFCQRPGERQSHPGHPEEVRYSFFFPYFSHFWRYQRPQEYRQYGGRLPGGTPGTAFRAAHRREDKRGL